MAKENLNIHYVFIIGGYDDTIRKDFQDYLILVRQKFLNEDKHESNPLNSLLLRLYRTMKILNVSCSIAEKDEYNKNEQFIDVLITHQQKDGSFYFFVRQCVH
ncbi:unnamed protein product [Adineta steineri]|uniref:Uncharacterized protein n=1 Tax=Adineta steineri TaxID=433720 RepID=A0A819FFX7_9BILA|nr:unnamed protein product [Adineta steineri]